MSNGANELGSDHSSPIENENVVFPLGSEKKMCYFSKQIGSSHLRMISPTNHHCEVQWARYDLPSSSMVLCTKSHQGSGRDLFQQAVAEMVGTLNKCETLK